MIVIISNNQCIVSLLKLVLSLVVLTLLFGPKELFCQLNLISHQFAGFLFQCPPSINLTESSPGYLQSHTRRTTLGPQSQCRRRITGNCISEVRSQDGFQAHLFPSTPLTLLVPNNNVASLLGVFHRISSRPRFSRLQTPPLPLSSSARRRTSKTSRRWPRAATACTGRRTASRLSR